MYTYIYIYTHTHTHTHIYIHIYLYIGLTRRTCVVNWSSSDAGWSSRLAMASPRARITSWFINSKTSSGETLRGKGISLDAW